MKTKPEHISKEDWDDVDIPELTDEQLAEMKPISHFPELAALVKKGRPVLANPKKSVNIRLSPEVLTSFKATGRGWQTRINSALVDWLREHRP